MAPRLLEDQPTLRRRKEIENVLTKRMFKVLSPMQKRDGSGTWWMRVGSGFTNKDSSINVYLDAVPVGQTKGLQLQIRELDENDLRERENRRATSSGSGVVISPPSSTGPGAGSAGTQDIPF